MLNVVAIDDHPMFLNGFANILSGMPAISTVRIYSSHQEMLSDMLSSQPHIVFVDLKMPDKDGFSLCAELKEKYPDIYIVAFTAYDKSIAEKAFKHGADTFIPKSADIEVIETFINDFSQGTTVKQGIYGVNGDIEIADMHDAFLLIEKLTPREKQIMRMEAKGMKRSEITTALSMSEHTYKSHIIHIRTKLNLKSISSLISFASRHFPIK